LWIYSLQVATKTIKPIYTKILEMKFIEELLAGSLDRYRSPLRSVQMA